VGLPRRARAVRAREGLPPARRAGDRHDALGRLRGRARAVHAARSSHHHPRRSNFGDEVGRLRRRRRRRRRR
jgi:hypothetical protein